MHTRRDFSVQQLHEQWCNSILWFFLRWLVSIFLKSGLSQLPLSHINIRKFGKFCHFYNPDISLVSQLKNHEYVFWGKSKLVVSLFLDQTWVQPDLRFPPNFLARFATFTISLLQATFTVKIMRISFEENIRCYQSYLWVTFGLRLNQDLP